MRTRTIQKHVPTRGIRQEADWAVTPFPGETLRKLATIISATLLLGLAVQALAQSDQGGGIVITGDPVQQGFDVASERSHLILLSPAP